MKAHQAEFPIRRMCQVLGVSTSGYYGWKKRAPSNRTREDQLLLGQIRTIHQRSRGTYGAPRIHAELRDQGIWIGRKRVARLMRGAGLQGVSRRRVPRTTTRETDSQIARDLVSRDFSAPAPNTLWVADITYVPTLA